MVQSMGLQRVRHNRATEQQQFKYQVLMKIGAAISLLKQRVENDNLKQFHVSCKI